MRPLIDKETEAQRGGAIRPESHSPGHRVLSWFYLEISLWAATVSAKLGERMWLEVQKSVLTLENELNWGKKVCCDKLMFYVELY